VLVDYQSIVDGFVRAEDEVITSEARDRAIQAAVLRYSHDRPRHVTVDEVSTGGGYRLPLPAGWVDLFSALISVEYPVGDEPQPSFVDRSEIELYRAPSGQLIGLPVSVGDGETVRITYTQHHVLDESTDTIPEVHREGVAALAAAVLCSEVASSYASDGGSSFGADTADHRTKTDRWRSLANDYGKRYRRIVGVSEEAGPEPAAGFADFDRLAQDGGDRIFHGRRTR
jgi:hypothetical protein